MESTILFYLVTTIRTSYLQLPSDQSFLSNTASSNHEVFCMACQSHSWFLYAWRAHLEFLFGNKRTKYATDTPLKQGHARKKTSSAHSVNYSITDLVPSELLTLAVCWNFSKQAALSWGETQFNTMPCTQRDTPLNRATYLSR